VSKANCLNAFLALKQINIPFTLHPSLDRVRDRNNRVNVTEQLGLSVRAFAYFAFAHFKDGASSRVG